MPALYLKYRPQNVSQLDEVKVREQLERILAAKTSPHAFLFVGPKGTGKTSSARIVAKAVNCLSPKKPGVACNKCKACELIDKGNTMDIIEIDAASNRGIDDIRELRERVKLVPSFLKFKVYIIDEVHMLTNEAFNALLKTLEEPPAHVKFILCTTAGEKLPETIVSRCFKVEFLKATLEELVSALNRVVKGEGLKINSEDLEKIAHSSDGSFRDAVKWLEVLSLEGKSISSKKVDAVINQGASGKVFDDWLVMIFKGKSKEALDWLKGVLAGGADVKLLTLRAVERLREAMLIKLKVLSGEAIKEIDDLEKLKQLTALIHQASREVKTASIASLPLELAILSWEPDKAEPEPVKPESKKSEPKVEAGVEVKVSQKSGKLDVSEVKTKWQEILKAMRPHNHSLEALLRSCTPHGFDGNYLVLNVFYQFHKDRLEMDRYKKLVEEVISKELNQTVRIKYSLSSKSDNLIAVEDDDIIKTAEEIFGSGEVN